MVAYRPPQMRAEESSGGKGGGKRESDGPRGGRSKADEDKENANAARRGVMAQGEGGDWYKRADGRRNRATEPTEVEVFGEVKERSTAGIEFDKYDNIPVQVSGNNAEGVTSINVFSQAKLTESLFENLRRCGYERPTPVQKYSIPIVVSGRDLMACAQTGSGKTCAFMVPCLESLLRAGPPPAMSRRIPAPCGLVLAPTRELAAQIHQESAKFSFRTGIKTCIIYGGAEMREQRAELEEGCDILVATPGRLTDMYERRYVSLALVHFFILDEADRMLDMGFEPQVRQIVEKTDMNTKSARDRQSMMFSATFSKDVQFMARDFLTDYLFITVGRVGSASELVSQRVVYAENQQQKVRQMEKAIKEFLPSGGLAVVFVETKRGADALEEELYRKEVSVAAIHGDRSQVEREEALAAFKSGANPVLVATDVAARGLDIPNVSLVVNFDMPKQLDDYVHRIGRTGRAGRKGTAVALVNERCMHLNDLRELLSEANQEIPGWYDDLCRNSRSRPSKGGGRSNAFGGTDDRLQPGSGAPAQVAPARAAPSTAQQNRGSFGNTGQEDAW